MARRLILQPQSELDIQAAAVWYEEQQSGLATRFLDELAVAFRRIEDNPRQFPQLDHNVCRALLHRFPFGIYFLETSHDITVLAVLHLHRQPDMWKSRN